MNTTISIVIFLDHGVERYEQVGDLFEAPIKCMLLGGSRWAII